MSTGHSQISTEQLLRRLQQVESELAIRNLIARYGMAADCGDSLTAAQCFAEDSEYVVSAARSGRESVAAEEDLCLRGRAAIFAMLESSLHQSLLPLCAHTVGPLTVEVSGDTARASGYSRIYHWADTANMPAPHLMRLAINEWLLCRVDDHWLIARRESRLLGEAAAQRLLRNAAWQPASSTLR